MSQQTSCTHVDQIRAVTPGSQGCEECLQSGDDWVNLRLCLTCGHVGCCDDSKNQHATKHYYASGHPIVNLMENGPNSRWCYVDSIEVP